MYVHNMNTDMLYILYIINTFINCLLSQCSKRHNRPLPPLRGSNTQNGDVGSLNPAKCQLGVELAPSATPSPQSHPPQNF